jgi:hypothetical protein
MPTLPTGVWVSIEAAVQGELYPSQPTQKRMPELRPHDLLFGQTWSVSSCQPCPRKDWNLISWQVFHCPNVLSVSVFQSRLSHPRLTPSLTRSTVLVYILDIGHRQRLAGVERISGLWLIGGAQTLVDLKKTVPHAELVEPDILLVETFSQQPLKFWFRISSQFNMQGPFTWPALVSPSKYSGE